jgi:predicted phosphodiesterase
MGGRKVIKPILLTLSQDIEQIRLYPIADPHLGDINCNYPKLKATLETIQNDPNGYVILAGDLLNNATKASVSDIYSEKLSPMEQINRGVDTFRPIKEKVVCVATGNHEERTYRQDGIDITRLVSRELGFEDKYREDFSLLFLRFGSNNKHEKGRMMSYSVYVNHGNGGGRKIGGKANRLNDLAMVCDADVFIVGHTHTPMIFKDSFIRTTPGANSAEIVERTYINTTAWLDYGGYGARQAYTPSAVSCPVITLDGRKKQVSVSI